MESSNQNLRKRNQKNGDEKSKPEGSKISPPPTQPVSEEVDYPPPHFGPMPTFPNQRFWTRMLIILGALIVVYFTSGSEKLVSFAKQRDKLNHRRQEVPCAEDYLKEVTQLLGHEENKVRCGRVVMDSIVTPFEAKQLVDIALRGFALTGEPAGGASILDLHSGALSSGTGFINFYAVNASVYDKEDYELYTRVRKKIHDAVAFSFDLKTEQLYLTKPTFFSRLTPKNPATPHDEYWHPHVDKETYESFHYTSLLYLNDYGVDFEGGRFIFDDPENITSVIEPRTARVLMFSSGKENIHRVERVKKGERFAITVSFTCDVKKAVSDPSISRLKKTS